MRVGGSNPKGAAFERACAVDLSEWYWGDSNTLIRGGGSGALATKRQLTNGLVRGEFIQIDHFDLPFPFWIECKHYKEQIFLQSMLSSPKNSFYKAMRQCEEGAKRHGLHPLIIWKSNNRSTIVATSYRVHYLLSKSLLPRESEAIKGQIFLSMEQTAGVPLGGKVALFLLSDLLACSTEWFKHPELSPDPTGPERKAHSKSGIFL